MIRNLRWNTIWWKNHDNKINVWLYLSKQIYLFVIKMTCTWLFD